MLPDMTAGSTSQPAKLFSYEEVKALLMQQRGRIAIAEEQNEFLRMLLNNVTPKPHELVRHIKTQQAQIDELQRLQPRAIAAWQDARLAAEHYHRQATANITTLIHLLHSLHLRTATTSRIERWNYDNPPRPLTCEPDP